MPHSSALSSIESRIGALAWPDIHAQLDARGFAATGPLLTAAECSALRSLYAKPEHFRSRVVMDRHNFGRGEYQYFSYPLPPLVAAVREAAYPQLSAIANTWAERLGLERRFPARHAELRAECEQLGQARPTPLLLKYTADDYNCLHQDLYGELVFPLQLAVLLDRPGEDFSGGEFVLTEQRPRMQSRVEVVPLQRGDAVVFAVRERPVAGTRGDYRVQMRHGVSRVHSGNRHTLGVIFHDAT